MTAGIHINATFGEKFGKRLCQWIAQVLRNSKNDHVARETAAFEWIGEALSIGSPRCQTPSNGSQRNPFPVLLLTGMVRLRAT